MEKKVYIPVYQGLFCRWIVFLRLRNYKDYRVNQSKRNQAKELLNETMEELNLSEQMSINGGGINASMVWYNLFGAFAKHGCAYPVLYKST